jgi:PHD/YefM family antitoxin component YafN of YafNO toxin-antitoxin module
VNADANVRTADQAIAILRNPGDSSRERLIAAGVVLAAEYEVLREELAELRSRPYSAHLDET